jgi:hypothetical protein
MSVEKRIFWLLVGILALYLVFSARGRQAVNRFLFEVFGYGSGSGGTSSGNGLSAPAPNPAGLGEGIRGDGPNPDETNQMPGVA